MQKWIVAMIGILLLTAGCGSDEQPLQPSLPTEVALNIQPADPSPRQQVTFSVTVQQNGAPVNDAEDVKLELWKDGQDQHETFPATKTGDGVYTAEKAFDEPGTYYVIYHVNARNFHNMGRQKFAVKGQEAAAGHSNHSGSHHHGNGVDFHFEPAEAKANQRTTLTVHIAKDNQPLTQATVQFEYWKNGDKKHQFVAAGEKNAGDYAAQADLSSPGKYTVKVHVEKGTIHDHKEYTISVQ
jgi:hypothetical protein